MPHVANSSSDLRPLDAGAAFLLFKPSGFVIVVQLL